MDASANVEYAGFWRRFNAYGIDATLVLIASMLVTWLFGLTTAGESGLDLKTYMAMVEVARGGTADPELISKVQDVLARSLNGDSAIPLANDTVFFVISALYNIGFVAGSWQATPGKHWLSIKVIAASGKRLGLEYAAFRHAASGISILAYGLGYITMFFTREKLALHDMICKTRVVRVRHD